ncbi:hypothetical protein BDP27DRAFT_935538 [Rhodocollybia butyracea]|uniref:Uncharacterized protein n=1 Tax=Rhodocollybia butyracea TaxID=206335 RepID=A0A9P5PQ00_9AGAR|nr:hypothetical protein BDP27DRAFT_935538 [Rhodocollybia butyracea]
MSDSFSDIADLRVLNKFQFIWSSRLTGPSMLFILCRYSFLPLAVLHLVVFSQKMTSISCRDLNLALLVFSSITGATEKLLSVLRVYALFSKKRPLLLVLLCPLVIADVILWVYVGVVLAQDNHQQRHKHRAILTMCHQ